MKRSIKRIDPALMVVLATICINMMGVGLAWPILPRLVGEITKAPPPHIAWWVGAIAVAFSLAQFIFAPIMGILSDKYGRRPVMLLCLTGLGLDMFVIAFAQNVFLVFLGRFLGGVFASTMALGNAYVADTFKARDRAGGFGLIGVAFGVGFIIGPVIGGILGDISIRLPFYVAGVVSLINVLLGYFFLRESLPVEQRIPKVTIRVNPFRSMGWLAGSSTLMALGLASFLEGIAQRGLEGVWVLFAPYQYGWGPAETGYSLAVVGISYIFTQGYLVRRVVRRFGEISVVIGGFLLCSSTFLLLALNTSPLIGFLGIVPHVIGIACATPALQALASQQVSASEQGRLQGALASINGLAAIIGPACASFTFGWFIRPDSPVHFPGAFFVLGAIMLISAALIVARQTRAQRLKV